MSSAYESLSRPIGHPLHKGEGNKNISLSPCHSGAGQNLESKQRIMVYGWGDPASRSG
jgi:hypothetical protein